ncbi:hypothetical protein JOD57_000143 [Geodermatophilus bullaregiensis]|uniref:hypothetical protein n=1 Tax=Geodermatophilus bullaregiensis TaxID=1564160 RepID=UPI00195893BC|nr:hypothetical protein [Geodermatophilus bullaregiensis]MBM7804306.1 hypothetical protein [Geodermatophilus bullaregiensis]
MLAGLGDAAVQADLALVQRYGTGFEEAVAIPAADLAENGDEVAAAAEDNARQ